MELDQAINLIQHPTIFDGKSAWADLGCGSGLFTNALANMLAGGLIYAVDKNINAFKIIPLPGEIAIIKIKADFLNDKIPMENLDGILMANSLHFVKDKITLIRKLASYFKTTGTFLIVEYNTDTPNPWVPYPVSYHSLETLAGKLGYSSIEKMHEIPSRFNRSGIYSALIT